MGKERASRPRGSDQAATGGASASIGLSDDQARELMQLRFSYQDRIGYNLSDPAVWFGNHLSNYLSALYLEATAENHHHTMRRVPKLRRSTLAAFASYLKRPPTADDLIAELGRFVTVPEFAAEAIRLDVQRLLA
jgi:hypothetical protein